MKILITGNLGLLGVWTSNYLLDKGYSVVGIDDCSGGNIDYLDNRIKFYKRDIVLGIDDIFEIEKPDIVIHYAAYAAECLSDYIKSFNYNNNIIASVNIINACINHNVHKIIFTSSMCVMGENEVPFTEDQIPQPIDSYGIAKLTIENELKISYKKFGLNYSILRPHNIIANSCQAFWDPYRNVLSIWGSNIINGKDINVYGDGLSERSFSDVKFMLSMVEKLFYGFNGEIFNIGSDQPITILEAARKMQGIANKLGYSPEIKHLQPRTEVKYAYSNHSKIINMLGFKDETNLDQIMEDLLQWIKSQPNTKYRFMDYEVNKNMYDYWVKK